MADAFISYRRKPSAAIAHLLQTELQDHHQLDIYLDTTRTDSAKVQFPERLLNAIDTSKIFICVLGESTLDSVWVLREIERAYAANKPCIPVFQESYQAPAALTPAVEYLLNFDGVHILDERGLFMEEAIAKVAALIRKTVAPPARTRRRLLIPLGLIALITFVVAVVLLNRQTPTEFAQAATATTDIQRLIFASETVEAAQTRTAQPMQPPTSTEDMQATVNAARSATAAAWTDTPPPTRTFTPTFTSSFTRTFTPSPTPDRPQTGWKTYGNPNAVNDLHFDPAAGLYAATSGGLVLWDTQTWTYQQWTVDDGLPFNDLIAVYVDHTGQIWIGSASAGLATRIDGNWLPVGDESTLGSRTIQDIAEDVEGKLWIATDGGGVSRRDGSQWTRFTPANSSVDINVYTIFLDTDGGIWFGSGSIDGYPLGGDLARFHNGSWESYGREDGIPGWEGREQADVWDLLRVPNGDLWIATPGGIARMVDRQWQSVSALQTTSLHYADGSVWAAQFDSGSYQLVGFDAESGAVVSSRAIEGQWKQSTDVPGGSVWASANGVQFTARYRTWSAKTVPDAYPGVGGSLAQLPDGRLFAGDYRGLYAFDGVSWSSVADIPDIGIVREMFVSSSGVLWVSGDEALAWLDSGQWNTRATAGAIWNFAEDADGGMWFGVIGQSPGLLNYRAGEWSEYSVDAGDFQGDYIFSMSVGASRSIWVSLGVTGALRIPSGAQSSADWETYTSENYAGLGFVYAAYDDRAGNQWFADASGNLIRHMSDGTWTSFAGSDFGASGNFYTIVEDANQRVWAYGRGAATYYAGAWTTVLDASAAYYIPDGLADPDGSMWLISYGNGLFHVFANGSVEQFTAQAYGLASNEGGAIARDQAGALWLMSSGGVSRYVPE